MTSNPLLLAAVIVSIVFSLYCVYALLTLVWMLRKVVTVIIDDIFQRSRNLSRAKKEIQDKNDPNKKDKVDSKKSLEYARILRVDLFTFKLLITVSFETH